MKDIAKIAQSVLDQSAYLHIKGVQPGAGTYLLAYKIAEHICASYEIKKKQVKWYETPAPTGLSEQEQSKSE